MSAGHVAVPRGAVFAVSMLLVPAIAARGGLPASSSVRAGNTATAVSGVLNAVTATSAKSAWAVGESARDTATVILRWNGLSWKRVPSPSPGYYTALAGVTATSATSAWAVGTIYDRSYSRSWALTLRWNGRTWNQVATPSPGTHSGLSAIAASAGGVWAVGSTGSTALILRWTGSTWTHVPSPPTGTYAALSGVDVQAGGAAWAVGTANGQTLTLRWNGSSWTRTPSPNPEAGSDLTSVTAVSAGVAWAAGFRPAFHPLLFRWNGTSWSRFSKPGYTGQGQLADVTATSARSGWAVGFAGYPDVGSTVRTLTMHWNGTAWTRVPSPSPGSQSFLAGVAATSARNAWAVGHTSSGQVLILRWNGASWHQVTTR